MIVPSYDVHDLLCHAWFDHYQDTFKVEIRHGKDILGHAIYNELLHHQKSKGSMDEWFKVIAKEMAYKIGCTGCKDHIEYLIVKTARYSFATDGDQHMMLKVPASKYNEYGEYVAVDYNPFVKQKFSPSDASWDIPGISQLIAKCPGFNETNAHGITCVTTESGSLRNTIIHLNDHHKWTRDRIADWIETLDEVPAWS